MALTFAQCKATIEAALGGPPGADSEAAGSGSGDGITYGLIIDQAGELLSGFRNWNWQRRTAALGFTAGQNFIALPADFGRFRSIASNSVRQVAHVRPALIYQRRREGTGTSTGSLLVAVSQSYDESGSGVLGGEPSYRLELDFTPSTTEADVFTLEYGRSWAAVNANNNPRLPSHATPLFLEILRQTARAWEEGDNGELSQRIEAIKRGVVFRQAVDSDGDEQPFQGQMSNPIGVYGSRVTEFTVESE